MEVEEALGPVSEEMEGAGGPDVGGRKVSFLL